ncbi:conserved Plasmodium protein, unknown function [Plasmodium gallinaceum]|uniref:HTH OST-type domain-containing protein n=1 Tax=Plasmodium gallinaceum TaxID=5849 RepID=A0A1J1GZD9_PLAGA|nr:conserved Plasmodium protein, unknown function [Plasmodium gallinaceum]CRG97934.1 conserved Plasmodium protein, unknown function [Plasmodium gallinaceum]
MNNNIIFETSDKNSSLLNYLNYNKTGVKEELNTNIISDKIKELDRSHKNIIDNFNKNLSLNMSSDSKNNLNNNSEKEPSKNRKSGTLLCKKKDENSTTNSSKENMDILLDEDKKDKEKLDNNNHVTKDDVLENKELDNSVLSDKHIKKNNFTDSGYIESLKCEIEKKTGSETIQKHKSKLNPIAPEFKPQNALYIYQKIQQHTKKNIILLIKSFAYKGIKLENISGEYCKKYNALLNLNHAGFTNIFDLLRSLDYCLIYEEIKEEKRNNKKEMEKNVERDTEKNKEKCAETHEKKNEEKNIEKDSDKKVENDEGKNVEKEKEKNIEKDSDKKVENNEEKNVEKEKEKNIEKDSDKNVENDEEKNVEKEKEKNIEKDSDKNVEKEKEKNIEKDSDKNVENEKEKNIEKGKEKHIESDTKINEEKYIGKNTKIDIEKDSDKNIENDEKKSVESDTKKNEEKNIEKNTKIDIEKSTEKNVEKKVKKDIEDDTGKNVENELKNSDNNEKNGISEQNLIIKYKTPKMDENKQFFVKIILGTLAECTNYNSKLSDEETPISNSVSLTKLPQEVKKIFGSLFNLKALQIRCGIDKLQIFLEEIQEIQILEFPNDIKLRITPQTFDSKIPELKYIKSLSSNELKLKSPIKLNSKKHSISMQFLNKNMSFNSYNGDNNFSMNKNKINSLDNIQLIKSINSNGLKNINYSFNKSNESSCKIPQTNLKSILFGESFNIVSNDFDDIFANKLNDNYNCKSNNYSNGLMNIYNKNKFSSNKEYSNKNLIPKILTKMQLHILLFQLIVILSERQKIEWNEISKIKDQILYSNSRLSENKLNEKDEFQENIDTQKNVSKHEVDIFNAKEVDINNNENDKKKVNILDFLNTSGTNGSEYQNESFKTYDTSNLFKSENLSSDKYTKNSDFFNSHIRENTNEQFIGVFVSSIKSEWNKTYSDQFPLSFYLNYYKTKKLRKLLEEIPNLIITGYGRTMQIFTLDAAQEYYDNIFSDKQANFKTFTKSKFTSLSNSQYFKDITYKDIAKSYLNGNTINLLSILGKDLKVHRMNMNRHYDRFMYKSNKSGNYQNFDNYRNDKISYKDNFEKKSSFLFKNENLEILRYHLHKLLYNLVIHVCKKQNSLFLKYKASGIILSEYETNKQLCGPVYYSSDLTYEDFVIAKKTFFEKEQIKKNVYILSQHGIYGIKFIHLTNEWFKLYKCELRPLMKICDYQKIGQMICNMPNVFVVGEGFDTKYIPNTQLDNESKTFNDLVAGTLTKTPTDNFSYNNKMDFQKITKVAANMPKRNNVAYESIMKLLFPNVSSQRNTNMQTCFNSYSSLRDNKEYKKNKSTFPDIYSSYTFKNDISINHLFKNL